MSQIQVLWKHCGKRRNWLTRAISPLPTVFLPVWRTFCHFHQNWSSHLQTLWVWKSLKSVLLERVNQCQPITVLIALWSKFVIWQRVNNQRGRSAILMSWHILTDHAVCWDITGTHTKFIILKWSLVYLIEILITAFGNWKIDASFVTIHLWN